MEISLYKTYQGDPNHGHYGWVGSQNGDYKLLVSLVRMFKVLKVC